MADHDARTRAYDFGRPDDDGDAITDEQPTTAMPRTRATPSTSRASSSSLYEGSDESTRVIPQQAPPPAPVSAPAAPGRPAAAARPPRAGQQSGLADARGSEGRSGRARESASPSVWARIGSVFLAVPLYAICVVAFSAIPVLIIVSGFSSSAGSFLGDGVGVSPVWTMLVTMLAAVGFFLMALTMRLSGTGSVVSGALSVLAGLGCFLLHAQITAALVAAPLWQEELSTFQLFAGPASGMAVSLLAAELVVFGFAMLGAGAAVSSARRHGWRKAVGF
ncbi:hypothetical protein [Pseudoclavibacter sp. VKM Ac-2867]|uniref:hypothetical protein n=1 Tax=Pseudoclavibacter sp. VKM Ac-2867 TaxID=2783829 RepID=UPI00188B5715|nr:hypothetical protein [Pseudoclavibacter sp. VKM Ac-2867]MBF4459861.1 hypothetical protein [Pseudoclavibacter sp. VKM Ac-2867]